MRYKRVLLGMVLAGALALAGVASWPVVGPSRAAPPGAGGITVPYAGRLNDAQGEPAADGGYDFSFGLYADETGGKALWHETQPGVPVASGAFSVQLGSASAIPEAALSGDGAWLAVAVRGPGEADFTALSPRQRLSAAAAAGSEVSAAAAPACPHDHFGETWSGSIGWSLGGLIVSNHANGPSLWGKNNGGGNAVRGNNYGAGIGIYGESASGPGTVGRSTSGRGVEGYSTDGPGIFAHSDNGDAIYVDGAGGFGINVHSSTGAAVYVDSAGGSGVYVNSAYGDGVTVHSAGSNYFYAGTTDPDFYVKKTGEVRSDVGFFTPANDFAELLPGVEGLQPSDVLVISADGKLARSTAAYQANVAGVYSTKPGFMGGQPMEGEAEDSVPLAIMGIVPAKASAENGAIHPGDLLATSATPGHAMNAGADPPLGTVIGKALETLDKGTGVIKMLVTLQ